MSKLPLHKHRQLRRLARQLARSATMLPREQRRSLTMTEAGLRVRVVEDLLSPADGLPACRIFRHEEPTPKQRAFWSMIAA